MPPQMEEIREAVKADPFTVIANAKKDLHAGVQDSPWLSEALSRFELQAKSTYGASVPTEQGSSR